MRRTTISNGVPDSRGLADRACSCPVAAGRPIVPGRVSGALGFWRGPPPTARVATMKDEADRAYRRASESGRDATSSPPDDPGLSLDELGAAFAEMLAAGHDPYAEVPPPAVRLSTAQPSAAPAMPTVRARWQGWPPSRRWTLRRSRPMWRPMRRTTMPPTTRPRIIRARATYPGRRRLRALAAYDP